jgi:hypothetical protein
MLETRDVNVQSTITSPSDLLDLSSTQPVNIPNNSNKKIKTHRKSEYEAHKQTINTKRTD